MKPTEFVKWLEQRIDVVKTKRNQYSFEESSSRVIGKGGQITAFKQVLDYYKKHAITHKFH
jgi:hypothetical protein